MAIAYWNIVLADRFKFLEIWGEKYFESGVKHHTPTILPVH
jgi:hypothetical protein